MSEALAEFSDYDGLRRALNQVRDHRKLSFDVMNDLIDCPDRYFHKILGPNPVKRMGMQSLGWAFGVLGVKCIIVEDPEVWARVQRQRDFKTRDEAHFRSAMHADGKHHTVTWRFLKKISRAGGKARAEKLTRAQRRKIARLAAKARWAKQNGDAKLAEHRRRCGAEAAQSGHDPHHEKSTAASPSR